MSEREELTKPIGMQDIRLVCGEGKLEARHVLNAVNIILERRAETLLAAPPAPGRAAAEPGKMREAFTDRAVKLVTEAAGHRDDWGKYEYAFIDLACEADALLAAPESALQKALTAMTIASGFKAISAEYDFSYAIEAVRAALSPASANEGER